MNYNQTAPCNVNCVITRACRALAAQSDHIKCKSQVQRELKGQTLAGLINNAGIANHAVLMHQPIEEFRRVMEVNLVGTLAVTQASISALHIPD